MDWIDFFQRNNIAYRTSGANVGRTSLVTHCVWCGIADQSEHLSVSLEGKGFKCWRDRSHAGKNPAKLIQALLNCSWDQAIQMAGQSKSLPNDFMAKVVGSLNKKEIAPITSKLRLPVEFKQFSKLPSCKMYLDYINSRGFTIKDTDDYDIYYASSGVYKGRIIFTVTQDGQLCGWTGRTVYSSEQVRYKTLTNDLEKARNNDEIPAPSPISDYLLFYDYLINSDADTIVLCEGPMDAWKVNILGKYLGVVSTCFFTSSASNAQISLLHQILPRFKNRLLVLDQNTFSKAQRIKSDLSSLDISITRLPESIKDPAELVSTKQLKNVLAIV